MPSLLRRIERAAGRDTTVTFVLGGGEDVVTWRDVPGKNLATTTLFGPAASVGSGGLPAVDVFWLGPSKWMATVGPGAVTSAVARAAGGAGCPAGFGSSRTAGLVVFGASPRAARALAALVSSLRTGSCGSTKAAGPTWPSMTRVAFCLPARSRAALPSSV